MDDNGSDLFDLHLTTHSPGWLLRRRSALLHLLKSLRKQDIRTLFWGTPKRYPQKNSDRFPFRGKQAMLSKRKRASNILGARPHDESCGPPRSLGSASHSASTHYPPQNVLIVWKRLQKPLQPQPRKMKPKPQKFGETEMGGVGCLDSYTSDFVEKKGFLGGFRKSDLRRVPRSCGAISTSTAEPLVEVPNQFLKSRAFFANFPNKLCRSSAVPEICRKSRPAPLAETF